MCIFHCQLIDLHPSMTHFVKFYLKVTSYFLCWGKNEYVTLGMKLLRKYIRKSKLVCTRNRYILCYNFQSIVHLKLKFWGYNEKNMGFHLTPKSSTSSWALGDENAMGTSYFNYYTDGVTNAWRQCLAVCMHTHHGNYFVLCPAVFVHVMVCSGPMLFEMPTLFYKTSHQTVQWFIQANQKTSPSPSLIKYWCHPVYIFSPKITYSYGNSLYRCEVVYNAMPYHVCPVVSLTFISRQGQPQFGFY